MRASARKVQATLNKGVKRMSTYKHPPAKQPQTDKGKWPVVSKGRDKSQASTQSISLPEEQYLDMALDNLPNIIGGTGRSLYKEGMENEGLIDYIAHHGMLVIS